MKTSTVACRLAWQGPELHAVAWEQKPGAPWGEVCWGPAPLWEGPLAASLESWRCVHAPVWTRPLLSRAPVTECPWVRCASCSGKTACKQSRHAHSCRKVGSVGPSHSKRVSLCTGGHCVHQMSMPEDHAL